MSDVIQTSRSMLEEMKELNWVSKAIATPDRSVLRTQVLSAVPANSLQLPILWLRTFETSSSFTGDRGCLAGDFSAARENPASSTVLFTCGIPWVSPSADLRNCFRVPLLAVCRLSEWLKFLMMYADRRAKSIKLRKKAIGHLLDTLLHVCFFTIQSTVSKPLLVLL